MRRFTALAVMALCSFGTIIPLSAADRDAAWVSQRVQEWQPTSDEKRWEEIGWLRSLRQALAVARERNRPVFLFTLDGKMEVGRC